MENIASGSLYFLSLTNNEILFSKILFNCNECSDCISLSILLPFDLLISVLGQISVFASGSEFVVEGDNVFLYCDAFAYPKPTVSWSKLNADDFIVVVSSWLNLTNIGRDEAGDYVCIANNTCGTRKSSRRTIDVQCKGVYINYYYEASVKPVSQNVGL